MICLAAVLVAWWLCGPDRRCSKLQLASCAVRTPATQPRAVTTQHWATSACAKIPSPTRPTLLLSPRSSNTCDLPPVEPNSSFAYVGLSKLSTGPLSSGCPLSEKKYTPTHTQLSQRPTTIALLDFLNAASAPTTSKLAELLSTSFNTA